MAELLTQNLIPTDSNFLLSRTERINKSKFTEAAQVISSPTGLWEVSLTFKNIPYLEYQALIGTLVSMRGTLGQFMLFDWSAPAANGAGGTYGIVNLSNAAPGLVEIDTALASTKIASAGDYVGIDGELKALVADVVTDSSGVATVIFEPFMRSPITAVTTVTFDQPKGVFRLKPGYKVPRPTRSKQIRVPEITIECVEYVNI